MYESVKDWIDVPVTVKPFIKRTATGGKVFGDPYEMMCYPQGEVNIVRNWQGIEVVSHNHLHVEGNEPIKEMDTVIFEGKELPVQAISTFYKDGVPNLKVVYI